MPSFKVHGLFLISATALSVAVSAQEGTGAPVGVKLAPGVRGVAQLDTEVVYTSNFFYQRNDEVTAKGVLFKPGVRIEGDKGAFNYTLGLSGELSKWDIRGDADDYEDSRLGAAFNWAAATRHRFEGGFTRLDSHDPFGTNRTEAPAAIAERDIDKWHNNRVNFTYRFGAQGAKLNLEAGVTNTDREYETNRAFTRFLDYTVDEVRAAAFYNLSSKTSLVAEVIDVDRTYDENVPGFPRDGEEQRYRVGVRWKATGKTIGDLRVGRVEHEFDDPAASNFEETDWQASVTWSPVLQTQLTLSSGRESLASFRVDTRFIDNQFLALDWTQDWSSLFKTSLTLNLAEQLFVDSNSALGVEREDELETLSLLAAYRLAPTVDLRGGWSRGSRDSNFAPLEFDTDIAFVGLRVLF